MLHLPANSASTATIVGIDPGSSTLGFAVIEFDIETMTIVKTNASTYAGVKLMRKDSWAIERHGERFARINAHKENLVSLFRLHNPIQIVCEGAFYNPRRPNAFEVLIEVRIAIKQAILEYDPWRTIRLIDPPTVKRAVNVKGNADKLVVRDGVLAIKELNYSGDTSIEDLDEHSIDAIAVAYAFFKELTI
jgi:Holliday junction resolvasome RuvABC endonuclease subunit